MASDQLVLRTLRIEDETSFREAVREFATTASDKPFAFQFDPSAAFADYVEWVNAWSRGDRLPENFVPNTYYVGVVAGRIVGRLSLRHCLNDYLERIGGHVGYAVIPSRRRRGYARQMLKHSLGYARKLGLRRVLVTCDLDNRASMRVIEANGGVLENINDDEALRVPKKRYWLQV